MTSNTLSQTQRRQLHVFTTAQLIAFLVSILQRWTEDFKHVSFNCKFSLFLLPAVQASMIFVSPLFPSGVQNMLPTPPRPPWLSKYDAVWNKLFILQPSQCSFAAAKIRRFTSDSHRKISSILFRTRCTSISNLSIMIWSDPTMISDLYFRNNIFKNNTFLTFFFHFV